MVDAHAAFVEAARLEPSQATVSVPPAALVHLFLAVQPGSADAVGIATASRRRLRARQEELVVGRVATTRQLDGLTPDRVLSDDASSRPRGTRQKPLRASGSISRRTRRGRRMAAQVPRRARVASDQGVELDSMLTSWCRRRLQQRMMDAMLEFERRGDDDDETMRVLSGARRSAWIRAVTAGASCRLSSRR